MNDIIGKFAIILFGIVLVFFVPVTIIALKQDNTAQSYIDNAVVEFVDNARATARITPQAYEKMVYKINSAHAPCEIKIWHSAKFVLPDAEIGSDKYSNVVATEDYGKDVILACMYPDDVQVLDYILKEGDYLKVTVQNESPTLGARLAGVLLPGYNQNSLFTTYGGYVGNETQ